MILGIDASNIRGGGGTKHLVEFLRQVEPQALGVTHIIVWGGRETLALIVDRPWLEKRHQNLLDRGLPHRAFWQRWRLSALAYTAGCHVLFVPGGSFAGDFRPVVTMSQNLLPFEWRELRRYGWSAISLKLLVLRTIQSRAFHHANGLIFLSRYARDVVTRAIKAPVGSVSVIPHGVAGRFACPPREQLAIGKYSVDRPFRILYVSIVDMYKHQWHVAEAVGQLRRAGVPIVLDLVGPAYAPALRRLQRVIDRIDPDRAFIRYQGKVPYSELHRWYTEADIFVFASSCENLPNILLEGMMSGLPIVCSNRGPMREVLGEAGLYCDPESAPDIARALRELIASPELREEKARRAFQRVQAYTWVHSAEQTLRFLRGVSDTFHRTPTPQSL